MLVTSSCVVADPPEYQEPVQTRPVLDVLKADPTTLRPLVVNLNDQVPISVPVRSEDAGELLSAHFYIDYDAVTPNIVLNSQNIAASTYADDGRVISFKWTVNLSSSGCHSLSLIVAHISSFRGDDTDVLIPEKAATDATIVTWWLNVNPATGTPTSTLVNCPNVGTVTGVPTQ
jgi:hypothetical protein